MQGRKEGQNSQGAESLWRCRMTADGAEESTMSQILSSIQYICFRQVSGSKMVAPNLLLAPGAFKPRYTPVARLGLVVCR